MTYFIIILLIILFLVLIFSSNLIEEKFTEGIVFNSNSNSNLNSNLSINDIFKPLILKEEEKLYYGLECKWLKADTFYSALKANGFKPTDNFALASLIMPCSYDTSDNEINQINQMNITNNKYNQSVRMFMLDNTDQLVSKLFLWKILQKTYGDSNANLYLPKSYDLSDQTDINEFISNYDKNKFYISKNNNQRQEGLRIHQSLQSILDSKDEYILVQELLQNPYLISKRKINLRVYVLVQRDYKNNIILSVYSNGFMYYTKDFFKYGSADFASNITTGYIDRKVYEENPLTHDDFRKYLDSKTRKLSPIEQFIKDSNPNVILSDHVFSQIYNLVSNVFKPYYEILGKNAFCNQFQLYGLDVAIDENLTPILMEINKGPDLTAKDSRDLKLKTALANDILKSIGLIPNQSNKFIKLLQLISTDSNSILISNQTEFK